MHKIKNIYSFSMYKMFKVTVEIFAKNCSYKKSK